MNPKKNLKIRWMSASGLSLVEVMIGAAIVGFLAIAMMTTTRMGLLGANSTTQKQDTSSLIQSLKTAMSHPDTCTVNLGGRTLTMSSPNGFSITDGLYAIDESKLPNLEKNKKQPIAEILPANVKVAEVDEVIARPIQVRSLQVVPLARLAEQSLLAELRIGLEAQKEAFGGKNMLRTLPIMANVDPATNRILSCGDMSADGPTFYNVMCEMSSNNRMFYNPTTKRCESKYEQFWEIGNREIARCPSGANRVNKEEMLTHLEEILGPENQRLEIKVCQAKGTGGGDPLEDIKKTLNPSDEDNFKPVYRPFVRNYSNGKMRGAEVPSLYLVEDDNPDGSCRCYYDTSYDSSGWQCQVYCERLRPEYASQLRK